MFDYYLSLDLGQSQDYSALSIIEEPTWVAPDVAEHFGVSEGWISPSKLSTEAWQFAKSENWQGRPPRPPLSVPHLSRWALGTSYPDVVNDILTMLRSPLLSRRQCVLLVDATGVGNAVADLFRLGDAPMFALTLTGGHQTIVDGDRISVPKRELVSACVVAFEQHKISIAEALPEAKTLEKELLAFTRKQKKDNGHESYEAWRERDHDDLVLSVAQAIWFARWYFYWFDKRGDDADRYKEIPVDSRVQRALAAVKRR